MEKNFNKNSISNFKSELLSPAGSMEAALAAFQYGADAIYLGVKRFSARAEADNFDFSALRDITGYAHSFTSAKKVYVTVNTLVQSHELAAVTRTLAELSLIGVDGVIIQDLGVLRLIKESFPDLEVHASTQMAIHNLEGALYAKELGFSRVVLARELSSNEIKKIVQDAGLEIEVFIHGALCYSYSGLCLFSSHCYGLSGNRGRCAYPCRDLYRVTETADSYLPFSMKDLALPEVVSEYQQAKVASLKIEGRKKSPLYVAAVTDYYRHILDGDVSAEELQAKAEDLKAIFSRPWCEFGVRSKVAGTAVDPNWTGHRGVEIGTVTSVKSVAKNKPITLNFKTMRDLELHDGLQINLPQQTKPFGFAVDTLLEKQVSTKSDSEVWKNVIKASAGSEVAVVLPDHYPHIPTGSVVYCGSSQEVKNKFKIVNVNFRNVTVKIPIQVELSLSAKHIFVTAKNDFLQAKVERIVALEPTRKNFEARGAFEKLGETQFSLSEFTLHNPSNLFVPVSILNEVRRELVALLELEFKKYFEELVQSVKAVSASSMLTDSLPSASKASLQNKTWILKTDKLALLKESNRFSNVSEIVFEVNPYLPENSLRDFLTLASDIKNKLRLALPTILRKRDILPIKKVITTLASIGFCNWEIANISHWLLLREAFLSKKKKLDFTSSWSCYALNEKAIEELLALDINRVTLSIEDSAKNILALAECFPEKLALIVYQDTPLFTAEACPYAVRYGCKGTENCEFKDLTLHSKAGDFIATNEHCLATVVNAKPFSLSGQLAWFNNSHLAFKVEFIKRDYSLEEALSIWEKVQNNQNIPNTHSANFERGLK